MVVPCPEQGGDSQRAALHAALDRVLDTHPTDPGAALEAGLLAEHELRCALDGARLRLVDGFDRSMAWASQGHGSVVSWLVAATGMPRAHAGGIRSTARAVATMDHVGAAADRGRLPGTHLAALAAARRSPVEELFDRDEAALVAEAQELSADALRRRLRAWWFAALAELGENEPDRNPGGSMRSTVRLGTGFAGRGLLDGDLTAVDHAVLREAIDAEIDRLRRDGVLDGDRRTHAELQADVLVELVRRGVGRSDLCPARPSVIAVVDADTLLARSDLAPAARMARRAELLGHGPVSDSAIVELLTEADMSVLVTAGGRALWLGRARRLATAPQRTAAVAASDGHCYWPGCSVPAHRCEIDHLHGWHQGGSTDVDNLAPICGHHNRFKYRHGYQAGRHPDGTIWVRGPDGAPVRARYRAA
jgi:hypothetical protein